MAKNFVFILCFVVFLDQSLSLIEVELLLIVFYAKGERNCKRRESVGL
jgi:hypothetical protein